jgi:ATP-dependent 26S proteasome regulatory subunit
MPEDQAREIEILIRARYPLIYVVSWEESRVEEAIQAIARARNKRCFVWTVTDGLRSAGGRQGEEESRDAIRVLDRIMSSNEQALYVLKDFHPFLNDPHTSTTVVRKLRDLTYSLKLSYKTLIFVSPLLALPPELEKEITVVDFGLPTVEELGKLLDRVIEQVRQNPKINTDLSPEERDKLLKAACGLTLGEAGNAFARSIVEYGRLDVDVIIAEKEQIIRKTQVLEYQHTVETVDGVGGLEKLKEWLAKRSAAFTESARAFGLPEPKGLLLLGVQGCGKSLTAKAVASLWQLPLLKMDVGRIFAGYVGASEENMRKALRIAESVAPCVLWIDEIEKGLSGSQSSGVSDGGTTARVFGNLVTWLQEKTAPVFVIATANDISELPPELMRKGRFDDIFFVDLPNQDERESIVRIHLAKRQRDAARFDLLELAEASAGFSGAELEQAVIAGMYDAFDQGRDLQTEDVLRAVTETFPLSKTMAEEIAHLRHWAATRARRASSGTPEPIPDAALPFGMRAADVLPDTGEVD